MRHHARLFVFLLAMVLLKPTEPIVISEVLDIIKVAKDVVITAAKAWNMIDEHTDFSEVPLPLVDKTERKLFNKMEIINEKLDRLSENVDSVATQTISTVLRNLPERVRLELRLNDLLDYKTRLDVTYRHLQQYMTYKDEIERITLEDYAMSIVSHDPDSARNLVERIHSYVVPTGKGIADTGLLELLGKSLQKMRAFILYLCLTTICVYAKDDDGASKVDFLRHEFLEFEEELWNKVLDYTDNVVNEKETTPFEVELIRRFEEFGDYLHKEMPYDITHGLDALESVWVWARSYSELRGIYALYEGFRRFQTQQTKEGRIPSPRLAWLDLTDAILNDPKNAVNDSITRVYDLINKERLFKEVLKETEGDMLCNTKQSPQQVLYNLYNAIALTELKGYSMIQFSYMLLKLYDRGNFTKEAQLMRDRFEQRTNNAIESIKKAMGDASRELWNCDPKKHVKGETYEEITQLLQGYIQNEVDLNPDGTCRENCAEYTYTKSHGCYQNLYCRQQRRCNGKIVNCGYVDSDMWVCPANGGTGRRYEYVEYENGRILGRKQSCSRGPVKVDSWWRWLFWHCSYCFCYCDEEGPNSDRYINMRAAIADLDNNMVVTGLRFVKQNRIIHLQIQEGRLLPRGNIDQETVHWVPVSNYSLLDRKIYRGQDYHVLTWEKRGLDLDDLVADEGHVVTGVRFKEIGSHLNFEIYITPFDFVSGRLLEPKSRSIWKDNPNTDSSLRKPRKKLHLQNPDVPIRSPSPAIPDSESDMYLEFTHTDMDRDAAQTTVPFIDIQSVESLLPVPLSGAGIYHKGRRNFGGFVAPKIITYDFSQHLTPAFENVDEPITS